jgi:hypothetical protein
MFRSGGSTQIWWGEAPGSPPFLVLLLPTGATSPGNAESISKKEHEKNTAENLPYIQQQRQRQQQQQ